MRPPSQRQAEVPRALEDLDAAWFSNALGGDVADVRTVAFGVGNVAATARVELAWAVESDGPNSLIAKVPVSDPDRRRAAMNWRCYEIEAAFYREVAPTLPARLPDCYWAGFDGATEAYAVLLEDLSSWTPGDDLEGCDPATATAVLAELALVHGGSWGDAALEHRSWLNRYPDGNRGTLAQPLASALPRLSELCGAAISAECWEVAQRFVCSADRYEAKGFGRPRTIVHADPRCDNLLFGPGRVAILDWQTVHLGAALSDVAYFLGAALNVEDRRACEQDLVREYHQRLVVQGVDLSWSECWSEYRRNGFALLISVLKTALGMDLGGRAVELMARLAARSAQQAVDLDALATLDDDA